MADIKAPETYGVIKLHNRSERCWAVVGNRSGAILMEGRRLMMRLARDEAARLAAAATEVEQALSRRDAASRLN